MNNIKNARACLTHCLSKLHYLILLSCGLLPCAVYADDWGKESANDITLSRHEKLNYHPTITFCIERDESTGKFQAINANQARFNRVWMDQNTAKHGSDATKALLKMAVKAVYKSFHDRSAGAKRYLPDEEGRVSVAGYNQYETDYQIHLGSDSLTLGLAVAF